MDRDSVKKDGISRLSSSESPIDCALVQFILNHFMISSRVNRLLPVSFYLFLYQIQFRLLLPTGNDQSTVHDNL